MIDVPPILIVVASFYLIADAIIPAAGNSYLTRHRSLAIGLLSAIGGVITIGEINGLAGLTVLAVIAALLVASSASSLVSSRVEKRMAARLSPTVEGVSPQKSSRQVNTAATDPTALTWIVRRLLHLIALTATLVGISRLPGLSFVPAALANGFDLWPELFQSDSGGWPLGALILIAGCSVAVSSGSSFVAAAIRPFADQLTRASEGLGLDPRTGFIEGGRTIGKYERLLVFIFVMAGSPTAIGFLLTAKSIFRFGDLTDSKNRQKAEYILLGTLSSFTFALVTAVITRVTLGLPWL